MCLRVLVRRVLVLVLMLERVLERVLVLVLEKQDIRFQTKYTTMIVHRCMATDYLDC